MRRRYKVRAIAGFLVLAQLLHLSAAAGSNEVWIGLRTDGAPGRGTIDDPFNGGTQEKLDSLMPTIPAHTRIHFEAGVFVTKGVQVKEGWRISGVSKNLTTIQLADNTETGESGTNFGVISRYFDKTWLNYFELSEMTLDCNRDHQPAFTKHLSGFALTAYMIQAKNARITNVRALGTWADPGEGFTCIVAHDGSMSKTDRIEISGVENINPLGYQSAIGVIDQGGGSYTGFIRNCIVTDQVRGSAFGASGSRNFRIYNNYSRNENIAVNFDTGPSHNLEIYGNRFYNTTGWGILFNNGAELKDIKIHDNFIEMARSAGPVIVPGQANATVQIYHNTIIQRSPAAGLMSGGASLTGVFRNNIIQNPTGLDLRSAPHLILSGNRDPSGKLLKPLRIP